MRETLNKLGRYLWDLLEKEHIVVFSTNPTAANIKEIYRSVNASHRPIVVEMWNEYIDEVARGHVSRWNETVVKKPMTYSGSQAITAIVTSAAFVAGGSYFADLGFGLLFGILAAMIVFLHAKLTMAAQDFFNARLEQKKIEVQQTTDFIYGYQLSSDGEFLRDEEPWSYIQSNVHTT